MVRISNYTTILLLLIVLILLIGVGIAIYYVLDLNWFNNSVNVYQEGITDENIEPAEIIIENKIKYDINKRTYNIKISTNEFKVLIYKDGTVGITMLENTEYNKIKEYSELTSKECKINISNIIRAYEVKITIDEKEKNCLLLLDIDGNLYNLDINILKYEGKYIFKKIEGLANIIDVKQISNDDLTENTEVLNCIAIDNESNELLLTNYLMDSYKNIK